MTNKIAVGLFSIHSLYIICLGAKGTLLTILMKLAEAINDAVTEQWLFFENGSGMGIKRLSSGISFESLQGGDKGAYLGVDRKRKQK